MLDVPVATPDTWFETMKGVWWLGSSERTVLRNLVRWREQEARRRDRPRAHIVRDEDLVAVARCERLTPGDVVGLLPRRTAKRYGQGVGGRSTTRAWRIRTIHQQAARTPWSARTARSSKRFEKPGVANPGGFGIAPELLARKRDLEADFRYHRAHGELPRRYREGWRRSIVADAFADILATGT